jgi:hypothetical protein
MAAPNTQTKTLSEGLQQAQVLNSHACFSSFTLIDESPMQVVLNYIQWHEVFATNLGTSSGMRSL